MHQLARFAGSLITLSYLRHWWDRPGWRRWLWRALLAAMLGALLVDALWSLLSS